MAKRQMNSKGIRMLLPVATVGLCAFLLGCAENAAYAATSPEQCETEVPDADEDIVTVKGVRMKIIDGDVYTCRRGQWVFRKSLKREDFKKYQVTKTADSCTVSNTKTKKTKPLTKNFSSSFEVSKFLDLFSTDDWTHFTLKSPKADSIKEYVELRNAIFKGGKFLDNRIDMESTNVHSGQTALRLYAVKPKTVASKSLVINENICFAKGDDLWFTGWFYLEKGTPSTLFDFENRRLLESPGIRLFIRKDQYAAVELKFAHKPQYNQFNIKLPRQKWFNLKLHLKLSNHADGVIELWQDGAKILDTTGQTLPTHDSILTSMQVGITATDQETVLLVDDVAISDKPL